MLAQRPHDPNSWISFSLLCLIARSSPECAGRGICESARAFKWLLRYWVMERKSQLRIQLRLRYGARAKGSAITKKRCGLQSVALAIETLPARSPGEWSLFTAGLKAFLLNGLVV